MGTRIDAALALITLGAFVVALGFAGSPISITWLVLGGIGTAVFELLAARDRQLVRRHWERRPVQLVALALALGVAWIGARVAPSSVLSAGVGALVTYLLFLAVVSIGSGSSR